MLVTRSRLLGFEHFVIVLKNSRFMYRYFKQEKTL